jgi:hypothetical protein
VAERVVSDVAEPLTLLKAALADRASRIVAGRFAT